MENFTRDIPFYGLSFLRHNYLFLLFFCSLLSNILLSYERKKIWMFNELDRFQTIFCFWYIFIFLGMFLCGTQTMPRICCLQMSWHRQRFWKSWRKGSWRSTYETSIRHSYLHITYVLWSLWFTIVWPITSRF